MGLTVSDVTTATSTTSSGTLEITGVSANVGDMLVVMLACDNSNTSGAAPSVTCSDSAGNTYTNRVTRNRTAGSVADDGVSIFSFTASVSTVLSSGTITLSLDPNTTSKAALLKKIVPDSEQQVTYGTSGGTTGVGTSPLITTSSITVNHVLMGFAGAETNEAVTADSDSTNGSWSTQQTVSANTGTVATSIRISSQQKTITTTGTQTYNLQLPSSRDWAINWMSFSATALPSSAAGALLSNARNRLVIS